MRRNRNGILCSVLWVTLLCTGLPQAGSLEPPGPPAPTMVSLEKLPASWHQKLGTLRFEIVMDGDAVLDHETGLVWQRVVFDLLKFWAVAVRGCRSSMIGGRYGWRLPTVEELATLVDVNQADPALPPLHPFSSEGFGGLTEYWTSTTVTSNPSKAWTVSFEGNGSLNFDQPKFDDINPAIHRAWCVRGGVDPHTGNE